MMRYVWMTALISGCFASMALATPEVHSTRLLHLCRLLDQVQTTQQLREAGETDGRALLAIARDQTVGRYARMRAANLLGAFDSIQVRQGLLGLVEDEAIRDREVKIQALAAWTGLVQQEALTRLESFLTHADPELRAAAVRNLARLRHPDARRILERRYASHGESTPWIQALLVRTLLVPR